MKLFALNVLLLFGLNGILGKVYRKFAVACEASAVVLSFICSLIKKLLLIMEIFRPRYAYYIAYYVGKIVGSAWMKEMRMIYLVIRCSMDIYLISEWKICRE